MHSYHREKNPIVNTKQKKRNKSYQVKGHHIAKTKEEEKKQRNHTFKIANDNMKS